MTKIMLKGSIPTEGTMQGTAFTQLDDVILYDGSQKAISTWPYLIKFVSRKPADILEFQGVDLDDRTSFFGSDGTSQSTFTVNLRDVAECYRFSPCSLDNMSATASFGILFLTPDYVKKNPNVAKAAGAGPKWPNGSGVLNIHSIRMLALKNMEFREALGDFMKGKEIDASQMAKFQRLLDTAI